MPNFARLKVVLILSIAGDGVRAAAGHSPEGNPLDERMGRSGMQRVLRRLPARGSRAPATPCTVEKRIRDSRNT